MSGDYPKVLVFPPLFLLLTGIVGLFAWYLYPIRITAYPGNLVAGLVVLFVALAIGRWGEKTMRSAGTNVSPRKSSTCIVTSGPFKYTRNPLYICLALIYLALSLLFNSMSMLALIVPFILTLHFGVVLREEAYLEQKFGEEYLAYKRRAPRWLW